MKRSVICLFAAMAVFPFMLSCSSDEPQQLVNEPIQDVPFDEQISIPEHIAINPSETGYLPAVSRISREELLTFLGNDGWSLGTSEYHVYADGKLSEAWKTITPVAGLVYLVDDHTIGEVWNGIGTQGEEVIGGKTYPFEYDESTNTLTYADRSFTILSIVGDIIRCTSPIGAADNELMSHDDVQPYVLKYRILRRNMLEKDLQELVSRIQS